MAIIANGLIIGVGAGVTTTILVGLWRAFTLYGEQREQIAYIRKIIIESNKKIWSDLKIEDLPSGEKVHPDMLRYVMYRELQTRLEVAISSRSNALSYAQVSALQNFLATTERMLTDLTLHERKLFPLDIFRNIYKELEDQEWLRLPKITAYAND